MASGHDDTLASSLPAASGPDAAVPDLVADRYRIVRWLGGGGMGRVYEALDTELGEAIALKVLRAGLSDESVERFRREVRLTRRIQHRNVARMFDIGEHRGDKFLTMELVAGESLGHVVAAGRLEWPRLRSLALQVSLGLAAAHATSVIHRDLKPDNVLVERGSDRVVITDFGIARAGDDASVTQIGMLVGTPRYMAPEQLAGTELDGRADLFALGVMLYELACGARPWSGDGAISIAVAQATQPVRPFSSTRVPPDFAELVMALLAIERDARPASATEVATRLGAMPEALPLGSPAASGRHTPVAGVLAVALTHGGAATLATPTTTLAVLAIATTAEEAHLGDVVREELTDALASSTLRVRAATAEALAMSDPREAGRALGVDVVVVGSVRRTAAGLRVSARLVGIEDGFLIWAHRTECAEGGLLATCDELSGGIALSLSTRSVTPAAAAARPTDPRAVELYLQARAQLRRFWGDHTLVAANLLEQALVIAPESVQITCTLALARTLAWARGSDPALLPPARAAVERALATGHGEAFIGSAILALNLGDMTTAASHIAIALARAPMAAGSHETAGRVLLELGPWAEARRHLETALALDSTRDTAVNVELWRLEALLGEGDAARARIQRMLDDPDPSVRQAGAMSSVRCAAWSKRHDLVLEAVEKFRERFGPVSTALAEFTRAWLDHRSFDAARWEAIINAALPVTTPFRIQLSYLQRATEIALSLEQPAAAFACLERAVAIGLHDLVWLDRCPLFDGLRDAPAFVAARAVVAPRAAAVLATFRAASATA